MRLKADLHTHSIASRNAYSGNHATASRADLARSASAKGIELLVVSDHGPACPGAQTVGQLEASLLEPVRFGDVLVLAGVEADPVPGTANGLDVPDEVLSQLDFVTVGFHPYLGYDDLTPVQMTDVLIAAMTNPYVDMICHPGNSWFPVAIVPVLEAAKELGVIVEVNAHSFREGSVRADSVSREREFAEAARDAGVVVALNSDAHHAEHVGDIGPGVAIVRELGMDESAFVNRDAATVLAHLEGGRQRPRLTGAAGGGVV